MKRSILFIAAMAMVMSSSLVSCKKGENDPFLSLRSRKARFAGEWKVDSYTETRNKSRFGIPYTEEDSYDGSTWVIEEYNFPKGEVDRYEFDVSEWTVTTDKDGNYSTIFDRTMKRKNGSDVSFQEHWVTTQTGHWHFMGKNKELDYKKKERAAITLIEHKLTVTDSAGTSNVEFFQYENDDEGDIWIMDMLKNKEMVVKITTKETEVETGIITEIIREFKLVQD